MRSHLKTILYSALLAVATTFGAVAAPPNKPGEPPPAVDIAYMNITSSVFGAPQATVRGLQVARVRRL